jgi:hypothetical protein
MRVYLLLLLLLLLLFLYHPKIIPKIHGAATTASWHIARQRLSTSGKVAVTAAEALGFRA